MGDANEKRDRPQAWKVTMNLDCSVTVELIADTKRDAEDFVRERAVYYLNFISPYHKVNSVGFDSLEL